jgi:hypothetical protein
MGRGPEGVPIHTLAALDGKRHASDRMLLRLSDHEGVPFRGRAIEVRRIWTRQFGGLMGIPCALLYRTKTRLRVNRSECAIHSGRGAPSRCRPPAHAAAHAATAPSSNAVARENARMMVLRRDFASAALAAAMPLSTRCSESVGDRPVVAPTN